MEAERDLMGAYIELERIRKSFGREEILKELTWQVEEGAVYGIVGNNGSGKTVLMKCICGFLPVTSGMVRVGGRVIALETDFPESLGVIIETPGFLMNLSGKRNLEILADLKKQIQEREIIRTMKQVGLDPELKKPVARYSLGMRQRLGIAQAIMEDPRLLVLDEPFNGLDRNGTREIREILLDQKKRGKTILLASHNREDIRILCDRVFEMDGGVMREVERL